MITEQILHDARDEIMARSFANEETFKQVLKRIPEKDKAKFEDLEHELTDFMFNFIYYKDKDVNRFIEKMYEREILIGGEDD